MCKLENVQMCKLKYVEIYNSPFFTFTRLHICKITHLHIFTFAHLQLMAAQAAAIYLDADTVDISRRRRGQEGSSGRYFFRAAKAAGGNAL
jgi:hypothetical protein